MLQLVVQGGTAIAVFVRCFADSNGIEDELKRNHYSKFPRGVLAAVTVILLNSLNIVEIHLNYYLSILAVLFICLFIFLFLHADYIVFGDNIWHRCIGTTFFLSCTSHQKGMAEIWEDA